eukprot:19901-Heterococcus_DN1.PRE.9
MLHGWEHYIDCTSLCQCVPLASNSGGKIPVAQDNSSYCPFDLAVLRTEVERLMQTFNMQQALHAVTVTTATAATITAAAAYATFANTIAPAVHAIC